MIDERRYSAVPHRLASVRLWLAWVLANAVGGAIGGAAIEAAGALGAAGFGLALAVPQWLVLRRSLPKGGWWVIATALGGIAFWGTLPFIAVVAAALMFGARFVPTRGLQDAFAASFYPLMAVIGGAVAGGLVGLMQQWVVLERALRHARWWTVASIAGGAFGASVAGLDLLGRTFDRSLELLAYFSRRPAILPAVEPRYGLWAPHGSVSGAAFGIAYALITGAVLVWLLRSRQVTDGEEQR